MSTLNRYPEIRLLTDYRELELLRTEGISTLAPPVFALCVAEHTFVLSPAAFAKLCRMGARWHEQVDDQVDSGPPYVVHTRVPYLDCDDEQTTVAFNTSVGFATRKLADAAVPLFKAELLELGFTEANDWYGCDAATVTRPAVPEITSYASELTPVTSLEIGLARLRKAVVCDSDLPVKPTDAWLETFRCEREGSSLVALTENENEAEELRGCGIPWERFLSPGEAAHG